MRSVNPPTAPGPQETQIETLPWRLDPGVGVAGGGVAVAAGVGTGVGGDVAVVACAPPVHPVAKAASERLRSAMGRRALAGATQLNLSEAEAVGTPSPGRIRRGSVPQRPRPSLGSIIASWRPKPGG